MTFSCPVDEVPRAQPLRSRRPRRARLDSARLDLDDEDVAKVSIVGIGMRSQAGVAHRMFQALADDGVNIKVITTSEIKVSVLIDRKYLELAVQALHDAFELDQPVERKELGDRCPSPGVDSRVLLTRLRATLAEQAGGQERLDRIVRLVAEGLVADVCSVYLRATTAGSSSAPPRG